MIELLLILVPILIFAFIHQQNSKTDQKSEGNESQGDGSQGNEESKPETRLPYSKQVYLEFCNLDNMCLTHKRENNDRGGDHYFQNTTEGSHYWIYRWPTTAHTNEFVKYGDPIILSGINQPDNTSNCGWHGCRVLQAFTRPGEETLPNKGLKFDHSWTASNGDNPAATRKFFLLPLQDSGKQIGDDVDLGEDLYLSSNIMMGS